MNKLAPALLALSLVGCSGPSPEEIKAASNACKEFITEEMSPRGRPVETTVFDVWEKRGVIVVEVGYRKMYASGSYSVRKCIYDEKKGRLSSPSPLSDSEWNR